MITIIGLGPGDPGQVSLAAMAALEASTRLLLRTERHPTVATLRARGIGFESLDPLYEQADTFEEVYSLIADHVLTAAQRGEVAYAVPGHPLMGERAVSLILERAKEQGIEVRIVPSPSYVDAVAVALRRDLGENLRLMDALEMPAARANPRAAHLIYQVYDPQIASEVKLALMEDYSDDLQVAVIHAAGVPGEEEVRWVPLYELDHGDFDHLSTVFIPAVPADERRPDFQDFVEVMARLRGENGCPWDRQQTHQTLKKYVIEETYEVVEAIDLADDSKLCEELGDLMLQVLFHAEIGAEEGSFDIRDVITEIVEKLIRRHPHVFGEAQVETAEEVLVHWERIKKGEKAAKSDEANAEEPKSVLAGVPRQLPALMRAHEISKKAARTGFDWESIDGVMSKLAEELKELEEAAAGGSADRLKDEMGDLLFVLVNIARHYGVDPEEALRSTTDKFVRRFRYIEEQVAGRGKTLEEMDMPTLDALWDEAKEKGR